MALLKEPQLPKTLFHICSTFHSYIYISKAPEPVYPVAEINYILNSFKVALTQRIELDALKFIAVRLHVPRFGPCMAEKDYPSDILRISAPKVSV